MVIPTSSADKQNIILKEGQKVMVLKSPKGIYMQLESGKIIAIRTALKVGHNKDKLQQETPFLAREMQKRTPTITPNKVPIMPATNTSTTSTSPNANTNVNATLTANVNPSVNANASANANTAVSGTFLANPKTPTSTARPRGANHVQFGRNNSVAGNNKNVKMGTAKPYNMKSNSRNMTPISDALLQGQYPMSNSNSSFDADISDDSQFLEKLGENLVNHQNEEDVKQLQINKPNEKGSETMMQVNLNEQQQQQQQLHPQQQQHHPQTMLKNPTNPMMRSHVDNKVNNGINDSLPTIINDKSPNMQHSQLQNKAEQINRPYHNSNTGVFNNETTSNGPNFSTHPNYNYNYNSTSSYKDVQGASGVHGQPQGIQNVPNMQPGQAPQDLMHQSNVMSSRHPDKYQNAPQHVS